jgi:hypothetical protein
LEQKQIAAAPIRFVVSMACQRLSAHFVLAMVLAYNNGTLMLCAALPPEAAAGGGLLVHAKVLVQFTCAAAGAQAAVEGHGACLGIAVFDCQTRMPR